MAVEKDVAVAMPDNDRALSPSSAQRCGSSCSATVVTIESKEINDSISSVHQIVRSMPKATGGQQQWTLQYRSNTGDLWGSAVLPSTSEALWRGPGILCSSLPTTAWIKSCATRVWAVQDGYQLMYRSGDAGLQSSTQGELSVGGGIKVTLVSSLQGSTVGGVRIEGFIYGINDFEPPLHAGPVAAHRFSQTLNAAGRVVQRVVQPREFDVLAFCAAPAVEQIGFCESARRTLSQ
ncbi:MAG: hypothetical protein FJ179_11060 [Gammaproteobacteria bacterium]|nr:hypothetical protein [Gammaproteobacteria bacterium]